MYNLKEVRAIAKVFQHLMRDENLRKQLLGENSERICTNILSQAKRHEGLKAIEINELQSRIEGIKG